MTEPSGAPQRNRRPYPIPEWIRQSPIFRRARQSLGERSLRIAQKANRVVYVPIEYPTDSHNRPRYGYGRAPHARLEQLLADHDEKFRSELEAILEFRKELLAIDLESSDPGQPHWLSMWMLGLDGASIYTYMRRLGPHNYLEVGSGVSTRFAARAKQDGGLSTTITSIDPAPRSEINALCDNVIRKPLEDCDLDVFSTLKRDDILFVDNSHHVLMNSDVTTFFLDVLPELPDGVLVGIHDVLWPYDYLPEWRDRYWSEQYVLAAYLLADCPWLKPLLACNYVSAHPELHGVLDPLWSDERMKGVDPRGFIFWARIER